MKEYLGEKIELPSPDKHRYYHKWSGRLYSTESDAMRAIEKHLGFPSKPDDCDTHTYNDTFYIWNGDILQWYAPRVQPATIEDNQVEDATLQDIDMKIASGAVTSAKIDISNIDIPESYWSDILKKELVFTKAKGDKNMIKKLVRNGMMVSVLWALFCLGRLVHPLVMLLGKEITPEAPIMAWGFVFVCTSGIILVTVMFYHAWRKLYSWIWD